MTRARERLYLTRAFRRGFWAQRVGLTRPSRFLGDVPQRLITSMTMAGSRRPLRPVWRAVRMGGEQGRSRPWRRHSRTATGLRHFKFGEGIVVSCVATDQDYEVTVAFKGESGIKKLLYSYAPLEKVE